MAVDALVFQQIQRQREEEEEEQEEQRQSSVPSFRTYPNPVVYSNGTQSEVYYQAERDPNYGLRQMIRQEIAFANPENRKIFEKENPIPGSPEEHDEYLRSQGITPFNEWLQQQRDPGDETDA